MKHVQYLHHLFFPYDLASVDHQNQEFVTKYEKQRQNKYSQFM